MKSLNVLVSSGLVLWIGTYACSSEDSSSKACGGTSSRCGGGGEAGGDGGSKMQGGSNSDEGGNDAAGQAASGNSSGTSSTLGGAGSSGASASAGAGGVISGGAGGLAPSAGAGADAGAAGVAGESDGGGHTSPPGCPIELYADGDVWDKTYDFQSYLVPLTVGPNGRLHAGFHRGYSFSDDDGKTWTTKDLSAQISLQRHWPQPAVSADGNSVWLYVAGQGTLQSLDAGKSFAFVSALSGMSAFDRGWVTVSPYHAQHVLAYAVREDTSGSLVGTLYRSIDGGTNWANLDSAIATAGANGALSAAFDPATPDHFWIADMPEGVFETSNGGVAFASVAGSTHDYISGVTRSFDGTDFRLVVTGSCSAPSSTVIGQNVWQASTGDSPHCCPWPALVADPFEPAAAVAYQCHDSGSDNLRYSTDGGVNLTLSGWPSSLDTATQHMQSAHVDPYHRRTFYATHDNQWTILKSTDGGMTWAAVGWLPGHGC